MRTRATRFPLALALAVVLAGACAVSPVGGLQAALRDISRTAAVPAQAAAAAGLSGPHGVISVHQRAPAVDVVLVPAALLTAILLVGVVVGSRARRPVLVAARAHARAPPVRWQ